MTKSGQKIRRVKVHYLFPNEEAFKKLDFGFSKVEDGYEVFSIPLNWKKKKDFDRYWIFDDKSRCRGRILLNKSDNTNSVFELNPIFFFSIGFDEDERTCNIHIEDLYHKISKTSFLEVAKFTLTETDFNKAMYYVLCLHDIFWYENVYGFKLPDDEVKLATDKDKILEAFKKADDFLEERFPGWKNPLLYWD